MQRLKRSWLFLLLLSLPMFGLYLGFEPLYDWDEAWYGQVAKEMIRSGNWMTLTWRGAPFFDKPPLGIWAIALSFKLFGRSEWAARLPSALAGILTILVVYWIGQQLFKRERPALLSALVLLTTLPYVKAARMAMLDAPMTLAFSLGIACYLAAHQDRRWGIGVGLSTALVWMIKGPLAILMLLVLGAFSLWEKRGEVWRSPWWWGGLLLGTGFAFPWYWSEWHQFGMTFLRSHFGVHILGRATAAMDGHAAPLTFYLVQLAAIDHPWFLPLIGAFVLAWRRRNETAARLALSWSLIVFGAFSLAATKLPWYVVPAYPGMALLVGGYLDDLLKRPRTPRVLGWAWLGLGGLLLIGGTSYLATFALPMDRLYLPAALCLSGGMVWAGAQLLREKPRKAIFGLMTGTYLAFLALMPATMHWETRFSPSLRPFQMEAAKTLPGVTAIATLADSVRPSFIYYLDLPERLVDRKALLAGWKPPCAALLTRAQWHELAPELEQAQPIASASGLVLVARLHQ